MVLVFSLPTGHFSISKQYSDKIAKILSSYLAFNFFCCPPEAFKTPDYNNS